MDKHLIIFEQHDSSCCFQQLWDVDTNKPIYCVSDLWECPEDAIIGRSLHDCHDALQLVRLGMEYSKQGYEKLVIDYVDCPEDEDLGLWAEEYITNRSIK